MIAAIHHVRALAASWPGRFILGFLSIQLLLPLAYYIGRRDPHDERFAWRMFSPMRMTRCMPKVSIDDKPVALESTFHEAWIELAQRGRFVVVEAMGAQLCRQHPGSRVTIRIDCTYVDGPERSFGGFDMCVAPELKAQR